MECSRYNGTASNSRSSTQPTPSAGNGVSSASGSHVSSPTLSGLMTSVKQEAVDTLSSSFDDDTLRLLMSAAAVTSSAAAYHQAAHYGGHLGGHGGGLNAFQSGRRTTTGTGSYGGRSSRPSVHVMQTETCVCEVCQVEFGRLESLFRHKLLHFNTGRVCYVCDLYLADGPDQLRIHVANQHRDIAGLHPKASDTAFVCPVCVQRFSTSKALVKHQGQMHCYDVTGRRIAAGTPAGRQDHSCAICAVDFACERALIGHLNSPQHREMKVKLQSIFICIDCRSIFSSRDSYAFHMMTRAQNETCDVIAAAQNKNKTTNHNNVNNNNSNGGMDDVISGGQANSSSSCSPPTLHAANSEDREQNTISNGAFQTPSEHGVNTTSSVEVPSPPWLAVAPGQQTPINTLVPPLLMPTLPLSDELLVESLLMRGTRAAGSSAPVTRSSATGALNDGLGLILEECSRRNRQLETAVLLRILDETARLAQVGDVSTAAAAMIQQLYETVDTATRSKSETKTVGPSAAENCETSASDQSKALPLSRDHQQSLATNYGKRSRDMSPLNLSCNPSTLQLHQHKLAQLTAAKENEEGKHTKNSSTLPSKPDNLTELHHVNSRQRLGAGFSDKNGFQWLTSLEDNDNPQRNRKQLEARVTNSTVNCSAFSEDEDCFSSELTRSVKRCWSVNSDLVWNTSTRIAESCTEVPLRSCRSADFHQQPRSKRLRWVTSGSNGQPCHKQHSSTDKRRRKSDYNVSDLSHVTTGDDWNGFGGHGGGNDVTEFVRRIVLPSFSSITYDGDAMTSARRPTSGLSVAWKPSKRSLVDRRGVKLHRAMTSSAMTSSCSAELVGNSHPTPRHQTNSQHRSQQLDALPQSQQQGHQHKGIDSVTSSPGSRTQSSLNVCRHCDIFYADRMLFMLHMGLHNVNNPWQCNMCGTVCVDRQQFALHVLHY